MKSAQSKLGSDFWAGEVEFYFNDEFEALKYFSCYSPTGNVKVNKPEVSLLSKIDKKKLNAKARRREGAKFFDNSLKLSAFLRLRVKFSYSLIVSSLFETRMRYGRSKRRSRFHDGCRLPSSSDCPRSVSARRTRFFPSRESESD